MSAMTLTLMKCFDYHYALEHQPSLKMQKQKTNGEKKKRNDIYMTDKGLEAALLPLSVIITILINVAVTFCMKI